MGTLNHRKKQNKLPGILVGYTNTRGSWGINFGIFKNSRLIFPPIFACCKMEAVIGPLNYWFFLAWVVPILIFWWRCGLSFSVHTFLAECNAEPLSSQYIGLCFCQKIIILDLLNQINAMDGIFGHFFVWPIHPWMVLYILKN